MLEVIFIRHGPTIWNRQKRLQGQTDIPLSREGRELLGAWQVPSCWRFRLWYCSPLQRARETALVLGLNARVEPLLIEMNWGKWEGKTLAELCMSEPLELIRQESRGLDLTPPGGESPRQVQQRLRQWADQLLGQGCKEVGAVCHKGIIRAVLADACSWDMLGESPQKLNFCRPQRFSWDGMRWHLQETDMETGPNRPVE